MQKECAFQAKANTQREKVPYLCVAKCINMALWHIHQPNVPHKVKCVFLEALHYEEQTLLKCRFFFYLDRYCHDEITPHSTTEAQIIPHSTIEAPLRNKTEKYVNFFPNCSCTSIPSLAKYSSIEIPSLKIMQDHPHPPVSQPQ